MKFGVLLTLDIELETRNKKTPAKDLYHNDVKTALQKDGWTITHDPYKFEVGEVEYRIDLGAEQLIAAIKEDKKVAIEIKSFTGQSPTYDFHNALGQFLNYAVALGEYEPERELYLAVPDSFYKSFAAKEIIRKIITRYQVKLLVFDPDNQTLLQWIK